MKNFLIASLIVFNISQIAHADSTTKEEKVMKSFEDQNLSQKQKQSIRAFLNENSSSPEENLEKKKVMIKSFPVRQQAVISERLSKLTEEKKAAKERQLNTRAGTRKAK
ncbi:MAG: hypothetical protein SGJ02_12520 [bacterium]|nr:hypothetical protein [bacterium]